MNDITMYSPRNLDELVATGLSKIIAGGTDLTIAMHEGEVCPDILIDVSRTEEMRRISESGGKIVIGAAVTFTEAENDPTIKKYFPSIARAASGVGSKQIRNRGTIGGNLANASPAGDMLPPLTALGARVVTVNSKNEIKRRTVNDIVAPGSPQKLKFDEAVVSIELPAPSERRAQRRIQRRPIDSPDRDTRRARPRPGRRKARRSRDRGRPAYGRNCGALR